VSKLPGTFYRKGKKMCRQGRRKKECRRGGSRGEEKRLGLRCETILEKGQVARVTMSGPEKTCNE